MVTYNYVALSTCRLYHCALSVYNSYSICGSDDMLRDVTVRECDIHNSRSFVHCNSGVVYNTSCCKTLSPPQISTGIPGLIRGLQNLARRCVHNDVRVHVSTRTRTCACARHNAVKKW